MKKNRKAWVISVTGLSAMEAVRSPNRESRKVLSLLSCRRTSKNIEIYLRDIYNLFRLGLNAFTFTLNSPHTNPECIKEVKREGDSQDHLYIADDLFCFRAQKSEIIKIEDNWITWKPYSKYFLIREGHNIKEVEKTEEDIVKASKLSPNLYNIF